MVRSLEALDMRALAWAMGMAMWAWASSHGQAVMVMDAAAAMTSLDSTYFYENKKIRTFRPHTFSKFIKVENYLDYV